MIPNALQQRTVALLREICLDWEGKGAGSLTVAAEARDLLDSIEARKEAA